jgi:hypothetical protein
MTTGAIRREGNDKETKNKHPTSQNEERAVKGRKEIPQNSKLGCAASRVCQVNPTQAFQVFFPFYTPFCSFLRPTSFPFISISIFS